ncbi:hypothetical protein FRC19_011894 [Serendipita sp. 401]|nr:hypothetical protein FRC19_011894 [Serendipita sp. 401]
MCARSGVVNPEIIAGTSRGRYFRISVIRSGDAGEWSIAFKEVTQKPQRHSGLFSNLFGVASRFGIASNASMSEPVAPTAIGNEAGIVVSLAISATEPDALDVWFTTSSSLSVWRVSDNLTHASSSNSLPTTEKLLCSVDARTGIEEKLLDMHGLGERNEDEMYTGDAARLAGSLPMEMQQREERALALAVKILDIKLINTKTSPVDPREPSSTPGERDDNQMETESNQGLDQLTALLLICYNAPVAQTNDLPVLWKSEKQKPAEKSYATVACRIISTNASENPSRRINSQDFSLSIDGITPLPYSDSGGPDGTEMSDLNRGVNLAVGSGGWTFPGWFFPKMAVVQTTAARPSQGSAENDLVSPQFEGGVLTLLITAFHGGVVFSDLDGSFKDHLYLKRTQPFPLPVGYGLVANRARSGLPYGNASARVSSSSINLQSSRSHMGPPPLPPQQSHIGQLVYMTSLGVVSVHIDFNKIAGVDKNSGGPNQVRSVMEQAMLYGPVADNPFSFRFSSNVNAGNLMIAAKQLSEEAISSNSKLVQRQLGLSTHLADRASRLQWLITFINENEVLNRLNVSLRTTLAKDAEKVAAAQGVWAWYDGSSSGSVPIPVTSLPLRVVEKSQNILLQAVEIYQKEAESGGGVWSRSRRRSGLQAGGMIRGPDSPVTDLESTVGEDDDIAGSQGDRELPDDEGETNGTGYVDPVRVFFRTKLEEIGALIPCSMKVVKNVVGSYEKTKAWPDVRTQAGRLALVLLDSASAFRRRHLSTYGLDPDKPHEIPWTADPRILEACTYIFEECSRVTGDGMLTAEVKEIMQGLATVICEGYREQLVTARQRVAAGIDWPAVQSKFSSVRRRIWSILVQHRAESHAFKLAEEYTDHRALIDLCYQVSTKTRKPYGPNNNAVDKQSLTKKLNYYADLFKDQFSFELYHWWIEHQMASEIFKEPTQKQAIVDKFFSTYDYPQLAWLHMIGKGQFTAASSALLSLAETEARLGDAKFLLSVGKLCEMVDLGDTEDDQNVDEPIAVYDELLDLVDVQQKLRQDLLEAIEGFDITRDVPVADVGSANLEVVAKASLIVERIASKLKATERKTSSMLLQKLVGNLIGDKRLTIEDTLDIIGLKDNNTLAANYGVALHLIYEAKSLSDVKRELAVQTLWRRIYLNDDWESLSDTGSYSDAQVAERLRSTALYTTLRDLYTGGLATMMDETTLSKLVRKPSESVDTPSMEELTGRFSNRGYYGEVGYEQYTRDDLALIKAELDREQSLLEGCTRILEERGLWEEISRLEESERPVIAQGDYSMASASRAESGDRSRQLLVERGNSLGIEMET